MNYQQDKFEEWALSECFYTDVSEGTYTSPWTEDAWRAWKACIDATTKDKANDDPV
jgi:hypothetical protein